MIEVTEEMVERARVAAQDHQLPVRCTYTDGFLRAILESALTPPQEPEIVVTEEQKSAGCRAYNDTAMYHGYRGGILPVQIEAAYRAMRRLEKPKADAKQFTGYVQHTIHGRKGDAVTEWKSHRRKDDPK